jgi:hypothetical protein
MILEKNLEQLYNEKNNILSRYEQITNQTLLLEDKSK